MNDLRIIPLGGMGHVTKNMFLYEYGQDRIIVDCGIGFPEADMLGVDFLIPDISYLKGKENSVKAILLTHGHDDHIGGLPYILPELPSNIPVYGSRLTLGFTQDTLKDFQQTANLQEIPAGIFNIGPFIVDQINITHSVPDSRHFVFKTPAGIIYHGSDYKIDFSPVDKKYMDLQKIAWYGKQGIDLLMIDCLRVEKKGFSSSESSLKEVFEREIADCRGRFIVTTMSSNIHRIQQAVDVASREQRKIAFMGRSIEENIRTATRLGYFNLPQQKIINRKKIGKVQASQLALIVAGSQGQSGSALDKLANRQNKNVQIQSGDKIVFSTDVIPGNENYYYALIDNLSKLGAEVSYYDILDDLHVSGHASRGEQELMLNLIKPKYIVPIGGTFRHMIHYQNMAVALGFKEEKMFLLEDEQSLLMSRGKVGLGAKVALKTIIVDGLGIGDVGKVVLGDRRKMADDGIVVIVLTVDSKNKQLLADPEIITRGFVYVRKSRDFISSLVEEVRMLLPAGGRVAVDFNKIKEGIIIHLEKYIIKETERSPMILPVLIEI